MGIAILVTGNRRSQFCEASRFPHFIDYRLKDCSEVANLTCQQPFTLRKISGTFLEADTLISGSRYAIYAFMIRLMSI
jgi:hypothetical protein